MRPEPANLDPHRPAVMNLKALPAGTCKPKQRPALLMH